ncbi:hypothetical protein ANCCEY_00360 [Ancylostoma ceylanicum]|uniref:Amino acid transporter transmembrane domain-containing protein n=1 Tax=Ancylostoma ceylanicum TaxID=53326 RepID=A0A0D6MA69_9BILA|nr:hypothetical protein ANCCEY_00360 [Ancylostoma ceylanicum]
MPAGTDQSTQYSPTMGLLYIFNLIVGTGALALPKAFQTAGYALSILVLLISCGVSYIAATFVVESLSVGNAVHVRKRRQEVEPASEFDDVVITESGPSSFEINEKIEVAVQGNTICYLHSDCIFSYLAFTLMILLASAQMMANGAATIPPAANVHGFGSLFGVAVYAFMCHHSIPSLVTPMSSKSGVFGKLCCVYLLVLCFYFTLSLTGSFAFTHVQVSDVVIPVLVIGLPTIISLITDDVLMLATITGSYPGVGVQFLIPCLLVMRARTYAKGVLNFPVPKKFASPFQSKYWPYAIFLWAAFAIAMATVNTLGVRF